MTLRPDIPGERLAGHALVEALIAQGVDTVFGVPGESYLAVLDGLHEHQERIRFIACRHEGGAAFMAEAAGKLTGRPGVCLVTRAPGATNASIGLHTAFQDSTPMVLLIGQVASDQRDREAFQEVDYRQMFGPGTLGMAKWAAEVQDADRLPEYLARAFHIAQQGRPGPVVLALPEDMLTTVTTAPVLPRVTPAVSWPSPSDLLALQARLENADRPLLLVGGGGWTPQACEALEHFARTWHLPVACGFRRQDLFDNRDALYAGDVGIGINPALAQRVRDADLIIALGPRLGEMTTGGYELLQPPRPHQQLVHIHAGAEELGRVYAADQVIQASMSVAALALQTLRPEDHFVFPWTEWTCSAHADYQRNQQGTPVQPMDMTAVIQLLNRLLPPDTIFTNGAGNYSGWLHRFHRYPALHQSGRTQLAPTSGAMGYGFPAAVAASLLQKDRWVVNIAGDGDFLMTSQEMATAMAHGARRLICLVVDNGSYGTIRMHQEREYPGRTSGSDLHNPDFAALARAYGWAAHTAEHTEAVEPALRDAVRTQQPTLIHIKLPVDISTSRTTLTRIREAALQRQARARGE
jgi:acetolactate synthase I/II/III large subunit